MEHPNSHTTFEIIDAASSQPGLQYGYYRIITPSSVIKYLAFIEPYTTIPDIRGKKLNFTTIPEGNWNVGYLNRKTRSDKFTMGATELRALQSVEKTWGPSAVDCLDLGKAESGAAEMQCRYQMYSAVYSNHFGSDKVIVSYEWCPDSVSGPIHETEIYSLIQDHNIGPRFLAHITENRDRVIGYMVERVPGRRATIDDLSACQEVLSKLHSLGIVHGSLRPTTFLITDGRAMMHSFGGSYLTDKQSVLDTEMASLEDVLRQEWPQAPPLSPELDSEIFAICRRDDGIHPAVMDQASREGKITITEAEHKDLLEELWRDPGSCKLGNTR